MEHLPLRNPFPITLRHNPDTDIISSFHGRGAAWCRFPFLSAWGVFTPPLSPSLSTVLFTLTPAAMTALNWASQPSAFPALPRFPSCPPSSLGSYKKRPAWPLVTNLPSALCGYLLSNNRGLGWSSSVPSLPATRGWGGWGGGATATATAMATWLLAAFPRKF